MKGSWSKGATPGFSDNAEEDCKAVLTDGGLDAETVLGSVAPGDVVEVGGSPYRVVDVDEDEGEGVLRLYDLAERTETIKAAGAGDVDHYLHRSDQDVIDERVRRELERRDVQEDDANVDEGEGVVTDGGEPVASTGGGRHAPAMSGSTTEERTYAHFCDEVGSTIYSPRRKCPLGCYEDDREVGE